MPFLPKHVLRTRPTCTLIFFYFILWLMKRYKISARHFRQNRHFPKGPFGISFASLFIIWRFRQLIAISAKYTIFANTVWRVWRLIAISGIFAEIATFQRAPFPSHLNFFDSLAILAIKRHFCHFRQIRQFR